MATSKSPSSTATGWSRESQLLLEALTTAFSAMYGHAPFAALGDLHSIANRCLLRPTTVQEAADALSRSPHFTLEPAIPIESSKVWRVVAQPATKPSKKSARPKPPVEKA